MIKDDLTIPFQDLHQGDKAINAFMESLADGTAHPMRAIEVISVAVADINIQLQQMSLDLNEVIKRGARVSDMSDIIEQCQKCRNYLHNFEVITRRYELARNLVIGAIQAVIYQEVFMTQAINEELNGGGHGVDYSDGIETSEISDEVGVAIDTIIRSQKIH